MSATVPVPVAAAVAASKVRAAAAAEDAFRFFCMSAHFGDADGNPNWQTLWKWHGQVEFGKNASWCELIACTAMIIGLHNTLWRGCGVEQLPVDTLKIALDDRWFVPRGFGKYDGQRIAARQRDFS